MRNTIELIEMSELVNAVVKTVFITDEITGQIDYRPEYVEVVKAFFKMKFYAPDEIADNIADNNDENSVDIESFYIDWVNGKYIETLNNIDMAQNNNIDKAICRIIEYANENEMIKNSGIVVTITGKALKHNSLDETADFIYKKDLKVRFNNAGSEHRLN